MGFNDRVRKCKKCPELVANRTKVVIGEGAIPCEILFLGEGPVAQEDKTGQPFIGIAGQLLRALTHSVGISMNKCHILNVIKCRPPSNRDPRVTEIENCREFLEYQIKVTKPKVIVAMGRYAQAFVSGQSPSAVRVMQNIGEVADYNGIKAILTFHPSYLNRNQSPEVEKAFKTHLRKAKRLVKGARK